MVSELKIFVGKWSKIAAQKKNVFFADFAVQNMLKTTLPNMFLSFCVLDDFFPFFRKFGFLGILGPPYCVIGATIRINREMLCLPYAGFFEASAFWDLS